MAKEFVEIAGIKWATMNVGAEKETDSGLYFQWGGTQGYAVDELGPGEDEKLFDWLSYKHGALITKYNHDDDKTVLEANDDAVTANWGNEWRMPTIEEYTSLRKAVNIAWANDYKFSGINGILFTDKTDSSKTLFFPACGYCSDDCFYNMGFIGNYWSSSLCSNNFLSANCLFFYLSSVNWNSDTLRRFGFPVRGVVK